MIVSPPTSKFEKKIKFEKKGKPFFTSMNYNLRKHAYDALENG